MFKKLILPVLLGSAVLFGCSGSDDDNNSASSALSVSKLTYIGEQVIPDAQQFSNTTVGGLSSIDYANGKYYMISDDTKPPIRFYEAELTFDEKAFSKVAITGVKKITDENGKEFAENVVDPEGLRFDKSTNSFIWTSEGQVKRGVNPSIRQIDTTGKQTKNMTVPAMFTISQDKSKGILNNGTFEGLSLDTEGKGYWLAMELPLIQDGEKPKLADTKAPVRFSHIDKITGEVLQQFAYELNNIARDSNPAGGFTINGVVEVLAVTDKELLVLERSFAVGHSDGGNNVKIYKVTTENATDIKAIDALKEAKYTPVKKELLFDFETVRGQLTNGVVDNIEGMTFGQDLPNGKKSLVLVADNNFSAFGPQLNQFVVFEVQP